MCLQKQLHLFASLCYSKVWTYVFLTCTPNLNFFHLLIHKKIKILIFIWQCIVHDINQGIKCFHLLDVNLWMCEVSVWMWRDQEVLWRKLTRFLIQSWLCHQICFVDSNKHQTSRCLIVLQSIEILGECKSEKHLDMNCSGRSHSFIKKDYLWSLLTKWVTCVKYLNNWVAEAEARREIFNSN